jgi:hypothetical protein
MVGRRVGMSKDWLLGEEPESENERCLCLRQAAGEEKARHAHCGTGSLDVFVDVVAAWSSGRMSNVVCDCTTAGFFLTRSNDFLESTHLDDPAQAPSMTGFSFTCKLWYLVHIRCLMLGYH